MKRTVSLMLMLVPFVSIANPQNIVYECSNGKAKRVIEVQYETEAAVPCTVTYTKAEGTKTLWSANNKQGYCEAKAQAFVDKQSGWGWDCKQAPIAEIAAAEKDVTVQ